MEPSNAPTNEDAAIVARLRDARTRVKEEMAKVVVGQEQVIDHLLGARLAATEIEAPQDDGGHPLSEREHEVLRLLALGHTNHEIADLLFISVRTAESHRARIMHKLGLHTRAEIVRYALATGVIGSDRPAHP